MAVGRKEYHVQRRQRQTQQIRKGRFRRRTQNNSVDARKKIRKHFIVKSESGIDNNQRVQIYTTHFDARNKINAKKGVFPQTKKKFTPTRNGGVATKALEDIQKGTMKPNTNINGNMKRSKQALNGTKNKPAAKRPSYNYNPTGVRESTFTGKSIKISTMNDLAPKERKTLVKGKSLSIVAKNKAGRANNKQLLHKTISNTWVGPSSSRLPSSSPEPSATTSKKSSAMPAKVVISNLHPNVTQEDILELFGAIGSLRDGRLKSVGTAEVIYRVAEDAFAAYSKYHGRNLDGQPMILKITTAEEGGSSRMMPSSRSNRYDPMPSLPPCYSTPVLSSNNGPSTPGAPVVFTVKL